MPRTIVYKVTAKFMATLEKTNEKMAKELVESLCKLLNDKIRALAAESHNLRASR